MDIIKGKCNNIVDFKQDFQLEQSIPFAFQPYKWDWEQYFLTIEHQGLVSQDRSVKEDHLWIWASLSGKFSPGH